MSEAIKETYDEGHIRELNITNIIKYIVDLPKAG